MNDVLVAVHDACQGTPGLQAAVVFGSVLHSDAPGDLDLALLWREDLTRQERWQRANHLAAEIEHRLAARDLSVDLSDLRTLPLILQHRVLSTGRAAYVADKKAFVRFSASTVSQALDFLPSHRRMLRASARRLASRDRS